jgi:outer membrane protein OmpA-like peptidoglycan-associated protein
MINKSQSMILLMMMGAVALSAGCTRHVSRDISPQGQAGEVIFPSADGVVLEGGTFPNIDNLRQIGPGVTKDQLYDLVGKPHFREGAFGVREWDYLFHFRRGDEVTTCQYKVIFDRQYRGQSFHWAPSTCADLLKVAEEEVAAQKRIELSNEVLFEFGRYAQDDILPGGRAQLVSIVDTLESAETGEVRVIGHADRIGAEEDNLLLSQRRADTVRSILVEQGVPSNEITSQGRGESEPVKQCNDGLGHSTLVACLQPNRRVEIVANGVTSGE